MTKTRLLIVDDDEDIRTQMKWALCSDYDLVTAGDRAGALAAFTAARPAVTLLDLGLPPRPNDPDEGLELLSAILALDPLAKVIVVSGQGDKRNALRAVGAGAAVFSANRWTWTSSGSCCSVVCIWRSSNRNITLCSIARGRMYLKT